MSLSAKDNFEGVQKPFLFTPGEMNGVSYESEEASWLAGYTKCFTLPLLNNNIKLSRTILGMAVYRVAENQDMLAIFDREYNAEAEYSKTKCATAHICMLPKHMRCQMGTSGCLMR